MPQKIRFNPHHRRNGLADDWLPGSHGRLLVSVRNSREAAVALAGGAHIIDLKQPARGPLGRASTATCSHVCQVVGGAGLVTAAAGELIDYLQRHTPLASLVALLGQVSHVKLGTAGLLSHSHWGDLWQQLAASLPTPQRVVLVAYAEGHEVGAPHWQAVADANLRHGGRVAMVDTWDKQAPGICRAWSSATRDQFVQRSHASGLMAAVAGRVAAADVVELLAAGVDVVGVRSAACHDGCRNQSLDVSRVAALVASFAAENHC
jgi:uncharacterized protein (UPF0264 family)